MPASSCPSRPRSDAKQIRESHPGRQPLLRATIVEGPGSIPHRLCTDVDNLPHVTRFSAFVCVNVPTPRGIVMTEGINPWVSRPAASPEIKHAPSQVLTAPTGPQSPQRGIP